MRVELRLERKLQHLVSIIDAQYATQHHVEALEVAVADSPRRFRITPDPDHPGDLGHRGSRLLRKPIWMLFKQ